MKAECEHTVLVVANDFRVLTLAQALLTGKGHRVLLASDARNAVELLTQNHVPIHSVAIRAGIPGHEEARAMSLSRGARPWTFHCAVNDQSVMLEGLDSGADRESAAFEA